MAILLNVCGLILMTQTAPDVTLQQFYQKYYQCNIDVDAQPNQTPWPSSQDISMFFPEPREWWPIFTVDQLNSPSYKRIIKQGIKPGILLPNEYFKFTTYWKVKNAVYDGAIPVALFESDHPYYFGAKATFSTAIGLRPLAALLKTGWDPNLNTVPAGTYIIQSQNNNTLPLPTREIQSNQHYFYHAQEKSEYGNGYQVIINPSADIDLNNIRYPHLGVSWNFNHILYTSTPIEIQTSFLGYLFIFGSIVVIPLDIILGSHYPDLLSTFGSSISWISLLLGGVLLLILVISIIRRIRKNATN